MRGSVVVMGVAGSGKSSLGAALAARTGAKLIEGDDHHSAASREKMRAGTPLTDADRDGWLSTLGELLRTHTGDAILTCSALKRQYRDRLRAAAPGLRFVFLEIARDEAKQRVAEREREHLFPASLVDSQFATLESPRGEDGVLCVDALTPLPELECDVAAWLTSKEAA
jgi:gluconokinase